MLNFLAYDFGYTWWLRYAMIVPLILAGSLAAVAAWRAWPRWVFIPLVLVAVWAAASIVVVVGMAGLAVGQGIRASNADQRRALYSEALQLASQPDASQIPLVDTQTSGPPVTEIVAPGVEVVYLVCHDVARPRPGMTYRVWFGSGGSFEFVEPFEPESDLTVLRLVLPPTVDRIIITEEPIDRAPTQPEAATIRWSDAA